jgi:hypothetical protein
MYVWVVLIIVMYVGDTSPSASSSGWSQLDFLLLGIALGSLLVMATVLYLYRKLQQVSESAMPHG